MPETDEHLHKQIRSAISDPNQYVFRKEGESVSEWAARAVGRVIEEHHRRQQPKRIYTDSLMEFVLARTAEEEVDARECPLAPWRYEDTESVAGGVVYSGDVAIADALDANGRHIARQDPISTLVRCARTRDLVGEYQAAMKDHILFPNAANYPRAIAWRRAMSLIAARWAAHPDYLIEWESQDDPPGVDGPFRPRYVP